jgi:alcohol dehydrogenase class IV
VRRFRWLDGERTIVFGRGTLADALDTVGGPGFTLLTTPRAAAAAADLVEAAGDMHEVRPGRVDEIAAELRPRVEAAERLIALGGGRVIDTAKALAGAAGRQTTVAAVPTTLSGAEMTAVHRQVAGLPAAVRPRRVRPAVVVNDPELSASQPPAALAQSACNALGHVFEGPLTTLRNPVATATAAEAARMIAAAFAEAGAPVELGEGQRDRLALGALLGGYVIGSTHYGLHHILSQTLVRFAGLGHGEANAIMLPHSLAALEQRFPDELGRVADALGEPPAELARQIGRLGGVTRLRDRITDAAVLERCAAEAAARPDLAMTPPVAQHDELLALYRAAW